MPVIPHHFSLSGLTAGAKLLCFGVAAALFKGLVAGVRSLKIEHVSPELVVPQEICRFALPGRWVGWPRTRKLDAGFLVAGIPATLLDVRRNDERPAAGAQSPAGSLMAAGFCRSAAIR